MGINIELHIKREGTQFKTEVKSPLGEKTVFFELDPSLHSKIYDIQSAVEDQDDLSDEFVIEFGTQLFNTLFSNIKDLFHKCLDSDHVNVILDMNDPDLTILPWELSYDPGYDVLLGADSCCSLTRRDQLLHVNFDNIDYPLRVLVIISSPMDLDEKGEYQPDPDEIVELMSPLINLESEGLVKVDFLERASVPCIQDRMIKGYHIVHFIGHGSYDSETGKGYLIIEDKNRNMKRIEGREVSQLFGINPPHLLILTACESSPLIPFLLTRKIPAVLAMQLTVITNIAHSFVERFYSLLLKGDSLPNAVSNARAAVLIEEGIGNPGWFTPVLYMGSESILNINTQSPIVKPEKEQVNRSDRITDLIGVETFVGRRKDLWLVEKALLEDNLKMVIVKGIGGIGKTALASKFVKSHKNEFLGVVAKKVVDPSMGVEGLLMLLDQFLMDNGDERLHRVIAEPDIDLKLEMLNQCLERGYLIVLDNFEILIDNDRITGKGIERFLQAILSGDHPSKVIITSRYGFTFTDEKGESLVKYVDLNELSFQFAGQLLEKMGITDFEVHKKIYEKIGGNPQFLEFFVKLTRTRPVESLLKDVTPVREKIGEWLLNELVGLLKEEEKNVLKKASVFRFGVDKDAFGASDSGILDTLVYYSLMKVDEYYFMHQGVRDYVYRLLSDDEKKRAHFEAVNYYRMLLEKEKGDLIDILELHHHLFESEQFEEAGNLVLDLTEFFDRWGYWEKLMELLFLTVKTTDGRTKAGGLHNLAIVLMSLGNYKEAEKLYRDSLDIAKSLGDKQGIASSLHQLGVIQEKQGNYKEAEKLYRESLDILKSLGDKQGIARSLHQLGMIQEDQGNYKEAEKLYRDSLDILKSLGDKQGIASSLHQLGVIQQDQGNYKEAEKLYRESLDILKSLGDKQGIASSLHQLGRIQEYQGNYKEAEKLYRDSLDMAKSLGDKQGIAKSLHQLGRIQQDQGNYKEAEKLYRESLDIAKSLGDKQGIASSLHNLGVIQQDQGNYKEAEKLYRESLDIAKSLGDKQGIAKSLHQLGVIQQDQGNYKEAEKLYRESLDIKKSLGDKQGIAKSLHQLGVIQEYQGNYKEAEKLYRESLDIAKSLGDKQGIASSLHQLGVIQEYLGTYEKAVEYYITSLLIFLELGSPNAKTVIKSLQRIRATVGESPFDTIWKTMTNQEVPEYIKATPSTELEEFIQSIIDLHEKGDQQEIEQATKEIKEFLKDSEPSLNQFLQLLLDFLSGKDISQKIKELEEPLKSILEKYEIDKR